MITVVGAAGYTGGLLLKLLSRHPHVGSNNIAAVSSSHAHQPVELVHHDLIDKGLRFRESIPDQSSVIFLCTGHGTSQAWMQDTVVGDAVVIDLSMDHRMNPDWTYGLPEVNRNTIASSKRIANPGCFATTTQLALLPLVGNGLTNDVVVNATTGSTGAGQAPSETTHYSWRANNLSVYKAFTHQHLAEVSMVLGCEPILIPLRGSFPRGILASCVTSTQYSKDELLTLYRTRYQEHPFVKVVEDLPDVKRSVGTNYCFIGVEVCNNKLLVVSVLDNLLKGASGQAVQNMNIAMGWAEDAGLDLIGVAQ